jgi:hypothetical protein
MGLGYYETFNVPSFQPEQYTECHTRNVLQDIKKIVSLPKGRKRYIV